MDFSQFITENMLILVPALYLLGMILKMTPSAPDWIIPWAVLILGILGGIFLGGMNPEAIIQGILCAGTAVFTNQLIKQTAERK